MKEAISNFLFVYFVMAGVAVVIGTGARLANPENCKVIVADYVFLGLPRLACEVK